MQVAQPALVQQPQLCNVLGPGGQIQQVQVVGGAVGGGAMLGGFPSLGMQVVQAAPALPSQQLPAPTSSNSTTTVPSTVESGTEQQASALVTQSAHSLVTQPVQPDFPPQLQLKPEPGEAWSGVKAEPGGQVAGQMMATVQSQPAQQFIVQPRYICSFSQ